MSFEEYLKTYQPFVYKTFMHALKHNKLSHAYLIKGTEGAPLLEVAKYLAKSLICENNQNGLACEKCMTCIRFDENNFADYMFLDGSKNNIKVSDIENIQAFFKNTPSEVSQKMIYIIHLLENSNREALNALLKFLEEPPSNIYCFITTYNEDRLLPTILSRMQHLKLLPLSNQEVINKATNQGISQDDAELLSNFYSNVDTLIEIGSSKDYIKIKDYVFDLINLLSSNKYEALYYLEKDVIPYLKDKVQVRLFLDILTIAFKDLLNIEYGINITLSSQKDLLLNLKNNIKNVDKIYVELMLARSQLELNVNSSLLLEHLFINIIKEQ